MATTIFREATRGTFAGYETTFTLHESKALAALCGRGVFVEAVEGAVGGEWCGDGWWQKAPITLVGGRVRFPSGVENRTHRIIRLVWNPNTGHLGAICQRTDNLGRRVDGRGRLCRDEDNQTARAPGGELEFADGDWRVVGPLDCDRVSEEFTRRCPQA